MTDNQTAPVADAEAAGVRPFNGTPATYRRIAVWGSIGFHAYLFIGFWAIKNFLAGEAWPTSWLPLALTVVSAALFARFSFRWIMRLDAQYGRGSGWELKSMQIKLPFEKQRRK